MIATAGVASRRKAADLVRAGRVCVDGQVVDHPGTLVDETRAAITVDGRPVQQQKKLYLLLNKPRGPISAVVDVSGAGRPSWICSGTLRSGFTPRDGWTRTRKGFCSSPTTATSRICSRTRAIRWIRYTRRRWRARRRRGNCGGCERVSYWKTGPPRRPGRGSCSVVPETSVVELTIHEGRKRQVKRMLQAVGHRVRALRRVRVGPLTLGELRPGEWRNLTEEEVVAFGVRVER